MKKTLKTLAVALPLILFATSCQKETVDYGETRTEQQAMYSQVFYTVDGKSMSSVVANEEAWQLFLNQMTRLAEEGHYVTFRLVGATNRQGMSKEKLTYITSSQTDAQNWCDIKAKDGYEVSMTYDPVDKVYICTAIK